MDTPDDLTITRSGNEREIVLTVAGVLDGQTAPRMEHALRRCAEKAPARVVISCPGLAFIDSAGLRAWIIGYQALLRIHGVLVIRDPIPTVDRVLQLTGLYTHLAVEHTD